MSGGLWTFNVDDGFAEAWVRGFKQALLSPDDYRKLGMCETLEDLRSALEDTDYGSFLQDEPAPFAVATIGQKCRQKFTEEFRYLQAQSGFHMTKFLDFIVAERMIDNVVSLIQGALNHKSPQELIARADPLGWTPEMRALLTIDVSGGYEEVYRTVLIDTPVGKYFEEYLDQADQEHKAQMAGGGASGPRNVEELGEAFSELDLEVMRASLKKSWLEDFYSFCMELDAGTSKTMGHILSTQADYLVLSVTLNSLNTPLGGASRLSDRNALYPSFGYLYPAGTDAMRKAYNDTTIRSALESCQLYIDLYDQCSRYYAREEEAERRPQGEDEAGARATAPARGKNEDEMSFEDAVYRQEVRLYEMAFEEQMHYGIVYAWVKLKEQEVRNILWVADMILMKRKDQMSQVLPLFASRT